ncbi:hypothetical protein [Plastoroseomonas hellenica]|uniref:hypothetical protein n=1 Tax=Plastoroseomonas hellenica TaxID=2687306 RepID=UPI00201276C6|nr:hypothetical protein [Plastoroseomonas hellenica]
MSSAMAWTLDARIPVHLIAPGDAVPEGAALLAEGADFAVPASGHAIGCACCLPRSPAASAFDRLFLARVKGERSFTSVAARAETADGADAIRWALDHDPVVSSRFRLPA